MFFSWLVGFIFRLFRYQNKFYRIILPGALCDLHKVFAEVPEDSRVLCERRLWFPTSDCLQTWLILSGTTRSRQCTSQPWSDPTCPRATAFCTLSCCFRLNQRDKGEVRTIRGSTRAGCVRPWLTRDFVLTKSVRRGGARATFRGNRRLGNINGALFLDGLCCQMSVLCTFWHYVYSKTFSFLRISENPSIQFVLKLSSVQ